MQSMWKVEHMQADWDAQSVPSARPAAAQHAKQAKGIRRTRKLQANSFIATAFDIYACRQRSKRETLCTGIHIPVQPVCDKRNV